MIFVSYSHLDQRACDDLLQYLRPLERNGAIDLWADTRLNAGDDWEREIERALGAARVAVLLISQSFLDSAFIWERELPVLVRREEAGELKLVPVFLSPSTVKTTPLRLLDASDHTREVFLSRYQGIGSPTKTLNDLRPTDRSRQYIALADQLTQLSGSAPRPPPTRRRTALSNAGAGTRYVLTVEITRQSGSFSVTYRRPGEDPFLPTRSIPSVSVDPPLQALALAFDRGGQSAAQATERARENAGRALFATLFGDDGQAQAVFTKLFRTDEHSPAPTAVQHPVHLRVCTTDDNLLAMPWRLMSWRNELLAHHRWTFCTTTHAQTDLDVRTTAPASMLVLAPERETETMRSGRLHVDAIREVFCRAWPDAKIGREFRIARTSNEFTRALAGMQPSILYVYAPGGTRSQQPGLHLDPADDGGAPGWLALDHLAAQLERSPSPVSLVVLNTHELEREALAPIVRRLERIAAQVVWRRIASRRDDTTKLSTEWFARWLGECGDPGHAMDQAMGGHLLGSAEAAGWLVHNRHRHWTLDGAVARRARQSTLLRLDRVHQKAMAARVLRDSARSDVRRCTALVAYGRDGNALDHLGEQLVHDLERDAPEIPTKRVAMTFPRSRGRLRFDLEAELEVHLLDHAEDIEHGLRRHAPHPRGSTKPTLWLDWGAFGKGHEEAALSVAQLTTFLEFCSRYLASRCPADVRIIVSLSLQVAKSPKSLEGKLHAILAIPWAQSGAFSLRLLPEVGVVTLGDLLEHLGEPDRSGCPSHIAHEFGERVIGSTGGEFEATVKLLDEAESSDWYEVLDRLRREQGHDTPSDDDLLE